MYAARAGGGLYGDSTALVVGQDCGAHGLGGDGGRGWRWRILGGGEAMNVRGSKKTIFITLRVPTQAEG